MYWIIIAILIGLIYLAITLNHLRHRIFLIFLVVLVLFIYITATKALSSQNLNWKSAEGIQKGSKIYFSWLSSAFGNVKTITANAAKMDWGSNSSENSEESENVGLVQK